SNKAADQTTFQMNFIKKILLICSMISMLGTWMLAESIMATKIQQKEVGKAYDKVNYEFLLLQEVSEIFMINGDEDITMQYASLFDCQIGTFPILYFGIKDLIVGRSCFRRCLAGTNWMNLTAKASAKVNCNFIFHGVFLRKKTSDAILRKKSIHPYGGKVTAIQAVQGIYTNTTSGTTGAELQIPEDTQALADQWIVRTFVRGTANLNCIIIEVKAYNNKPDKMIGKIHLYLRKGRTNKNTKCGTPVTATTKLPQDFVVETTTCDSLEESGVIEQFTWRGICELHNIITITFWIFLKFVSSRIAHFIHRQNINPADISEGLQEIGLLIQEAHITNITIEKELNQYNANILAVAKY
ncbi:hypothetical protein ACJX0J_021986, partial [Zea mays]